MKPIERMALVGALWRRVTRDSLRSGMVLGYRKQAGGVRCVARESWMDIQGLSHSQCEALLPPFWEGRLVEAIRKELEG